MNKGFSLVEALVATAIFGVILTATAGVMQNLFSAQKIHNNYTSAEEVVGVIKGLLGDPRYCALSLAGLTVTGPNTTVASSVSLFDTTAAGTLGTTRLYGTGVGVDDLDITSIAVKAGALTKPNNYIGSVEVLFKPKTSGIVMKRDVKLFIATTGTGSITSCSTFYASREPAALGVYSADCTDFSSKGWSSKLDCMQDGRWHVVYKNSAAGASLPLSDGSVPTLTDVLSYTSQGVTVGTSYPAYSSSLLPCASFVFYSGVMACLSATRSGISSWSPIVVSPIRSGVTFSTGALYEDADYNSPATLLGSLEIHWWIKY